MLTGGQSHYGRCLLMSRAWYLGITRGPLHHPQERRPHDSSPFLLSLSLSLSFFFDFSSSLFFFVSFFIPRSSHIIARSSKALCLSLSSSSGQRDFSFSHHSLIEIIMYTIAKFQKIRNRNRKIVQSISDHLNFIPISLFT